MVANSLSRTKNDVDAKSDSARRAAMAADGLQLSTFRVGKDQFGRGRERHTISMRQSITLVKTLQIDKTSERPGVGQAIVAPMWWMQPTGPVTKTRR